jgi:hypothetical protein
MANTGHTYGAWAFVQESASDWNADALADNATDTSDAITVTTKSAILIGMAFAEDNTGAIDGIVTIFVLGENDIAYEETTIGNPMKFTITPVQNDTVHTQFSVDPRDYHNFKIAVFNESGQELAVSCKIKTADVPVAA